MARSNELLVDQRIVERNIEKGLLTEADYKKHIDGLADSESKSEPVKIDHGEDVAAETSEEG